VFVVVRIVVRNQLTQRFVIVGIVSISHVTGRVVTTSRDGRDGE
jgi:hypothetical protein